ncbi:MAG: ABC transporter ATP-binding protein [Deltaproteobacteria bacterium]|nr:MAG: ABC transporter ATP-binding protein [Deltaproteobacteria bacterium]
MDKDRKLLEIKGVSKRFGGLQALVDVSFSMDEGELIGLIGPNASGKTTFLNIVNGYYPPSLGTIYLDGQRIDGLSPNQVAKRGVTRMFQVTRIFPRMSVLENMLTIGYAIGRIPIRDIVQRARRILVRLSLDDMIHEDAGNLSGGQRKILEFGTCFMANPRLVLLDEPFASIHPELKGILEEFMRAHYEEGGTLLLVSHDIPSVVASCPRLIVLNAGAIIADGPTEEVLKKDEVAEAYLGGIAREV